MLICGIESTVVRSAVKMVLKHSSIYRMDISFVDITFQILQALSSELLSFVLPTACVVLMAGQMISAFTVD